MHRKTKTAVQTAVLMAALTLISKLFGFLREMVMANFFGTSYITDAYIMSFTMLSVLFGGLITAISTAYIPLYSKINESKGKAEGDRFSSAMISILLIISFLISIIGIIFSDQIVTVFAGGFNGETARLASFYVKVMFSYVIFASTASILESYLQYKGTFLPQIIGGYSISIGMIVVIIISAYTSYYYLAFGMLLGYSVRFAAMALVARKKDFKYAFTLRRDSDIKEITFLALPTFIGSYMLYINQFINKTIASGLKVGSISALNYAALLNNMIMSVTITVLSTIIYPKLAKANSLEQYDSFNKIISTGFNIVFMIALPCTLGSMLYSNQIVQIVYERGAFDSTATVMTSSAFFFYSSGLLFISVNSLLTKVYYSMHDMKTPMFFAGIGVIINIVFNLMLVQTMAHSGLALATSIASFCSTMMLYFGLKLKYPHIKAIDSVRKLLYITFSAILAVGSSYIIYKVLKFAMENSKLNQFIELLISVTVAGMIYLALLITFKVSEVKLLRQILNFKK